MSVETLLQGWGRESIFKLAFQAQEPLWVREHLLFHSSSGSDSAEDWHHLLKIKDMDHEYHTEGSEIAHDLAKLGVQTQIMCYLVNLLYRVQSWGK